MNPVNLNILCKFQRDWAMNPASLCMAEKSRRIGFTWVQAMTVVLALADRPAEQPLGYYHSSADMTASSEFVEYCAQWAQAVNAVAKCKGEPEVIDEEHGISAFVMRFANGSKIVAGSSNPKFFRSKGGRVGLDEFAFHAQGRELFKAAHATAMFWGHPMSIWSTHNGEGSYFNGLIKQARAGALKAALHRVTILDAVEDGIVERIRMRREGLPDVPAPDLGARQAWLDELRATCPDQATWDEEYMCLPQSEANSLLSYELIRGCERQASELPVVDDPRLVKHNGLIYVGMDIGRQHDLTVIWALARIGDVYETRLIKTFQATPYDTQEQYLNLLMTQCRVGRVCIDATGIGDMLAERAQQRWGAYRIEKVKFTPEVKSNLAMPLVRLFEDRLLRIPADPAIREDLHKIRRIVTAAGNVRFDARHDQEGHADRFWSLALAYSAADPLAAPLPAPMATKPEGW